ncbi:hypothetical protein Bhyg_15682, partial [Pseudolycoriella hygida]
MANAENFASDRSEISESSSFLLDDSGSSSKENALPNIEPPIHSFYILKLKRKGLKFQSIKKEKDGTFIVSVMVDYLKYFGRGATQLEANNNCASSVLDAFESGQHERDTKELYENSFNNLNLKYPNALYRKCSSDDQLCKACVNVEGVEYFGDGETEDKAKNDAAWTALKSIWNGDHQKLLEEMDDYWYDNESFQDDDHCGCKCH